MQQHFHTQPAGRPANRQIIAGPHYRITVLTERLLRFEYSEQGQFEDGATQTVINRDFPEAAFSCEDSDGRLEICTEHIRVLYDKGPFSPEGLFIQLAKGLTTHHSEWRYGQPFATLGGTKRTLDGSDGETDLEPGLMSQNGFSVMDDSRSLLIGPDGWVYPRPYPETDFYFWGYGHDYQACLEDFYHLTGQPPLLPRFALGNWWSRYYSYSSDEYLALFQRFADEHIPFSVAVLDMNWHPVDVPYDEGSGWTGYSFDRALFPEPKDFLDELHRRGLRVTLNLHPGDGVRFFEDAYSAMCEKMGQNPEAKKRINFDIADPRFAEAYLEILHHPLEDMGVDFWWMDWQQPDFTKVKGLSALWMLNYLHFQDSGRNGRRPLAFSRYAGPGSHRYPIGFSGDTVISWATLDFQPYFTATASNIGFTWWSHDIGGHMGGRKDDELSLRWVQFGVFSPIMRLHSTNNRFNGKEPWNYRQPEASIMADFLRLRHRLVPYLYTMNYLCHTQGLSPVEPLYYRHDVKEAYQCRNAYAFGPSLLVHPVTTPVDPEVAMSRTDSYLPEGTYYDIFTGMRYTGGRKISFFRGLYSIPVLAKAGAVLPMDAEPCPDNALNNPRHLLFKLFAGASGNFDLYEDDGLTMAFENGACAHTILRHDWAAGLIDLTVNDPHGILPTDRSYTFELNGICEPSGSISCLADGQDVSFSAVYEPEKCCFAVCIRPERPIFSLQIHFGTPCTESGNDIPALVRERLHNAAIAYETKEAIFNIVSTFPGEKALSFLCYEHLSENLLLALAEILLAGTEGMPTA